MPIKAKAIYAMSAIFCISSYAIESKWRVFSWFFFCFLWYYIALYCIVYLSWVKRQTNHRQTCTRNTKPQEIWNNGTLLFKCLWKTILFFILRRFDFYLNHIQYCQFVIICVIYWGYSKEENLISQKYCKSLYLTRFFSLFTSAMGNKRAQTKKRKQKSIFLLTSGAKLSPPSRFKTAGSTNRMPLIEMRPRSRRFYEKQKKWKRNVR